MTQRKGNPRGFHSKLTPPVHKIIIDAIEKGYIQNHIAALAGIHKDTFNLWLKKGFHEAKDNICTPFAQLYIEYTEKRAKIAGSEITQLRKRPKNFQATVWFLERVFRDEYGQDSDQIKELADIVNKLLNKEGIENAESNHCEQKENPKI